MFWWLFFILFVFRRTQVHKRPCTFFFLMLQVCFACGPAFIAAVISFCFPYAHLPYIQVNRDRDICFTYYKNAPRVAHTKYLWRVGAEVPFVTGHQMRAKCAWKCSRHACTWWISEDDAVCGVNFLFKFDDMISDRRYPGTQALHNTGSRVY